MYTEKVQQINLLLPLILGGNVICLDFWGRKSGPYIQALHFCLSLGLLTGPLLVDPLSQTHVPNVLQKALPFALSHPGKALKYVSST